MQKVGENEKFVSAQKITFVTLHNNKVLQKFEIKKIFTTAVKVKSISSGYQNHKFYSLSFVFNLRYNYIYVGAREKNFEVVKVDTVTSLEDESLTLNLLTIFVAGQCCQMLASFEQALIRNHTKYANFS